MKLLALNGSPRKKWNTATLLEHAMKGAESEGAETEQINLYSLKFKGCVSCFACKLKGSKSFAKCAAKDELTPVLEKMRNVDAIILGSPIFFGSITSQMKALFERFIFPYKSYDLKNHYPNKIPIGFIYTMNIGEDVLAGSAVEAHIKLNELYLNYLSGYGESLIVTDTYQFEDYSKVDMTYFDPEKKKKRREEHFPIDCENAFNMGKRFANIVKDKSLITQ